MKKVAIIQSNYLPWKGYFDAIHQVDEFILYDDVQYTKNDWRNRNTIKTPYGKKWLTLPVTVRSIHQPINEVKLANARWPDDHWNKIRENYRTAPFFPLYAEQIEDLIRGSMRGGEAYLSVINHRFLTAVMGMLDIRTPIRWSKDYGPLQGRRAERVINLCRAAGADYYLSGPAAKAYINPEKFVEAGIELHYMDYSGYPEYRQLYPPFDHTVSILDLLFSCGSEAAYHIWGWREDAPRATVDTLAQGVD